MSDPIKPTESPDESSPLPKQKFDPRIFASGKTQKQRKRMDPRLFFSIPLLIGLCVLIPFVPPLMKSLAAKSWQRVPCTIISSSAHSAGGGSRAGKTGKPSYKIKILYRYKVGEQEYHGERYNFGLSGHLEWKATAAVEQYRAGKEAFCLVNPKDPMDSVISTELGTDLIVLILSGIFTVVGLYGFSYAIRHGKYPGDRSPSQQPGGPFQVG